MTAKAIIVTGPSGVGKSTLVRAMQEICSHPLLALSIDDLYHAVPPQWAGSPEGVHAGDGFSYEDYTEHSEQICRIRAGAWGIAVAATLLDLVDSLLHRNINVIVDGIHEAPESYRDLRDWNNRTADVVTVALTASNDYLAKASMAANNRRNLWRYQPVTPDEKRWMSLNLDRTGLTTDELVKSVLEACKWE